MTQDLVFCDHSLKSTNRRLYCDLPLTFTVFNSNEMLYLMIEFTDALPVNRHVHVRRQCAVAESTATANGTGDGTVRAGKTLSDG